MRGYRFITLDVFTDRRFGGNPLAVFPDAAGLSDSEMQSLATEFNLSETTFVLPPADPAHTARVRIFNTHYEMPFAGHPNVGTGYALATLGRDQAGGLLFEELAGLVAVRVRRGLDDEIAEVTINAPQPLSLGREITAETVAGCAGLDVSDVIVTGHSPIEASMGNGFVIAEVSAAGLAKASPDIAGFRRALAESPGPNGKFSLYLYALETEEGEARKMRARMFAPLSGVYEDAATGSAATSLGGLLLSLGSGSSTTCEISQGVEMGRPSLLRVTASRTPDGIRASVGGACVPVLRGEVEL